MSRRIFVKWALIGTLFAIALVWVGAPQVGGLAGMLRVGDQSGLRPLIEEHLGEVPLAAGIGHDGQYYYAIGLDLLGSEVPGLIDNAGFRYRRIILPALGSLFGLLDGWPLLYGLITMTVISFGVAAGTIAVLARHLGMSELVALTILLNPGMLLSVRLLTPDALGMALMSFGLLLVVTRSSRPRQIGAFSLSALSKEAFLLTPVGLGIARDRSRWWLAIAPIMSLGLWITWIMFQMGGAISGEDNFGFPFRGIMETFGDWSDLGGEGRFYVVFALLSIATAFFIGVTRKTWLRWPLLLWAIIGVLSSTVVWAHGNNAARVFLALPALIALSFGSWGPFETTDPEKIDA